MIALRFSDALKKDFEHHAAEMADYAATAQAMQQQLPNEPLDSLVS